MPNIIETQLSLFTDSKETTTIGTRSPGCGGR